MVVTHRCADISTTLDSFLSDDYRLDMIEPAGSPKTALLSKDGVTIRLESSQRDEASDDSWVTGRAGMMYRDLIPERVGGRIIASHIRLAEDGPVPDYVHYHKIEFQMIYCLRGRIHVVYEDQGPPFWLEAGDCVLQPPEIRHRVLESLEQAEVVEISMPAVHETWVEHEIELPTSALRPQREFSGQRFCRFIAADAEGYSDGSGFVFSDMGIGKATGGIAEARRVRSAGKEGVMLLHDNAATPAFYFCFVTRGELGISSRDGGEDMRIGVNESLLLMGEAARSISAGPDTEFLEVSI